MRKTYPGHALVLFVFLLFLVPTTAYGQIQCCCDVGGVQGCFNGNAGFNCDDWCVLLGFTNAGSVTPYPDPASCQAAHAPLPVELLFFDGTAMAESQVALRWQTASERNNAGFEVQRFNTQRSILGEEQWIDLGFVQGNGTTLAAQRYDFVDARPSVGINRYRLKQVDFDGTHTYSETVEVSVDIPGRFVLSTAHPNPFNLSTEVSLAVTQEQHVRVKVTDLMGRTVRTLIDGILPAHTAHQIPFDAGGLPDGIYLIRVEGAQFSAAQPVILAR